MRKDNCETLRRALYVRVFDQVVQEETVLKDLDAPLRERLVGADGSLAKLAFVIERAVDLAGWCQRGEELFDLRYGNANLVVNTDADQVIIASSVQKPGGLPEIDYDCGSLENTTIRGAVCQILEGGERAFLERERRYRLRWGHSLLEEPDPAEAPSSAPSTN